MVGAKLEQETKTGSREREEKEKRAFGRRSMCPPELCLWRASKPELGKHGELGEPLRGGCWPLVGGTQEAQRARKAWLLQCLLCGAEREGGTGGGGQLEDD